MIERLRAAEGVKLLANPTLVTRGGRAASFISGGKVPVAALDGQGRLSEQLRFVGTQVELTPRSVEDEKVRFDIQLGVNKLSTSQRAKINGKSLPLLRRRAFDTGFQMRSGQACVMAGLAQRSEQGGRVQELELLVLIRAEIIGQCAQ